MRLTVITVSLAVAFAGLAAAPPGPKKPAPSAARAPQSAAASPSAGKGDPYSITVPVDASAASASVAQTTAINGGRARAWAAISHRLVPQKDWPKLPTLDSSGVERLIRGYTVADEKRSTTRYVARITYVFNPNAVRHVLKLSNVGLTDQPGTAILLVALSPTYNAHSPWAQAVAGQRLSGAQFPLVTPIGDSVDQSTLGPLRFSDASWSQIQPAATRVRAGEAVLLQASSPAGSKMTVRMRRVGPGRPVPLADVEITIPAGTPPEKVYTSAAIQAEAGIEDAWKNRGSVDLTKKSKLVAEVRITSLEEWTATLARLGTVPAVSDVDIVALNTGEGRVSFSYTGTTDQLRSAAAQSKLGLADRGGSWWISPASVSNESSEAPE
ncbi:MAG: DUF2066 domain-containing protein [Alphaproteobacteria bacterium]|nr:DUF2066 domain-containing protein [Alphaproteobacteria bacterium]